MVNNNATRVIGLILGLGALVMLIVALPTLLNALWFAGRMFLPYQVIAYAQGIANWANSAQFDLAALLSYTVLVAAANPGRSKT